MLVEITPDFYIESSRVVAVYRDITIDKTIIKFSDDLVGHVTTNQAVKTIVDKLNNVQQVELTPTNRPIKV